MAQSELDELLSKTTDRQTPNIVDQQIEDLDDDDRDLLLKYVESGLAQRLPYQAMARVMRHRFGFTCALQTLTKWLHARAE